MTVALPSMPDFKTVANPRLGPPITASGVEKDFSGLHGAMAVCLEQAVDANMLHNLFTFFFVGCPDERGGDLSRLFRVEYQNFKLMSMFGPVILDL
jgi:hypothetical protein